MITHPHQMTESNFSPPYILAVDIGTSHVRALLIDSNGEAIPGIEGRQSYRFTNLPEGGIEIDADHLLDKIFVSLDLALEQAGRLAKEIIAVATCTFVSNILGVNSSGAAVTPLFPYSDTRPAAETRFLRKHLNEETIRQRVGCYFHSSYLPARFLWLARTQPDLFTQVRSWLSLGEYLWLKLFGETAVSYSAASWTGLLDRHRLAWDAELMEFLPIKSSNLSPLCDLNQPRQGLRGDFRQRWSPLADIPWFPAVGDGAAANIGSGCTSSREMTISLGSTSAVRLVVKDEIAQIPSGLWCYRVDQNRNLLGGALTEGGNLFNWLKQLLHLEQTGELENSLLQTTPGSHGLTFLPLIAGERSPGWADEATGTITGLTLATTPLAIIQAGLEGVICRIAQLVELLLPVLPSTPQMIASGGAAVHSPFMLSRLADALGLPVYPALTGEASARGAALLALEALGLISQVENFRIALGKASQPDPDRHQRFKTMIASQKDLYNKIFSPARA